MPQFPHLGKGLGYFISSVQPGLKRRSVSLQTSCCRTEDKFKGLGAGPGAREGCSGPRLDQMCQARPGHSLGLNCCSGPTPGVSTRGCNCKQAKAACFCLQCETRPGRSPCGEGLATIAALAGVPRTEQVPSPCSAVTTRILHKPYPEVSGPLPIAQR